MLTTTIILLLLSIYFLITGVPFTDIEKEAIQYKIDKLDGKTPDETGVVLGGLLMLVFGTTMAIVNLVYLSYAYVLDILKYPTVTMVLLMFIPGFYVAIKAKLSKPKDQSPEQQRAALVIQLQSAKKYTAKGILLGIARVTYFSYMLWIILGGN